jgi:hypothetical protein
MAKNVAVATASIPIYISLHLSVIGKLGKIKRARPGFVSYRCAYTTKKPDFFGTSHWEVGP